MFSFDIGTTAYHACKGAVIHGCMAVTHTYILHRCALCGVMVSPQLAPRDHHSQGHMRDAIAMILQPTQ